MKDQIETLLGILFGSIAIAGLYLIASVVIGLFIGIAIKAAKLVM